MASAASIVKVTDGYNVNVFKGKQGQMVKVAEFLDSKGFIPKELVQNEVTWFYEFAAYGDRERNDFGLWFPVVVRLFKNLGIDDYYFALESVDTIGNHIMALYGAKIFAYTKNDSALDINLESETDEGAVYIHTSRPGVSQLIGPQHERRIDAKYLDESTKEKAYRLESFRSSGTVSSTVITQLRCYFITHCQFVNPNPTPEKETDIRLVSDKNFLEKATEHTINIYEDVMKNVLQRTGPVIEMYKVEGSREHRIVIGYKQRTTQTFFSAMSDLYHYYDLYSTRKYVEQFSNGVTIMSIYLNPLPNSKGAPIESSIYQIIKEASLLYCLPTTPLQFFFQTNKLSVQEAIYGYVGWIFAQHFLNRLGNEYGSLSNILDHTDPVHEEVLNRIKKRLRQDTFTREYILDIVKLYPDLVKLLYANFAMIHYVNQREASLAPTLSYQRLQTQKILTDEELYDKLKRTTSNSHEFMVLESFLIFNKHVLKTNFYQPTKVALSFRMDARFLPEIEYPQPVFGMFLVVGSEFRGFHLRFRDVARGGIRIIRSRNNEAYSINLRTMFDENYGLASTQQRKNKDIPEGGSKGTILLDITQQDKAKVAFDKYVDAMLDLLIDGQTPGIKEKVIDLYGKPEILFFGPDEGTADYMDWASQHARKRGAHFWKAFTTGKSQSLGGIPHDLYGMTTRSVHQYVLGIYRKLGLKEEQVTKLQTGGPDGDLGSNEIKISKDKTIGVVDGSGVLYDPEGIDREELLRLANSRLMISNFNPEKLGKKGFKVLVDESNVKLPSGEIIDDGLSFRNNFHVNPLGTAQVFVPCGGRPEAVDLSNVGKLLDIDGHPRFKYIVEGANLFFTQEARLRLEKAGAVIFKDASANKGGVTSSSLEVLAALAFNDKEFEHNMCVKDGTVPAFYEAYVKEVQRIIEKNAELEFDCMWREHRRTKTPRSVLSDDLSYAIVQLQEQLQKTKLWDNVELRRIVLEEAFPKLLLNKLGLETLLARIPENYVRAIFGAYLASRFVYRYGISPSQFAFFEFMGENYFNKVGGMGSRNNRVGSY
ncbi:Glutamate/Leucine/Phenylalanine/Valine dehydrogenase-domain-containing protein [Jimgerdemannia flammicorona]|uniref:NAD-specific glutamate dehydrogenase n=1 Tax=Jimgerdemannia flammicorona TaxID=994334 RepID=A0A433CWH4_9FUNG|nr:Glutamate/Leucine/Phenylalanine/Valine dehydrogenase-domain-containing protein [Jimgerdemannia flammicorona]